MRITSVFAIALSICISSCQCSEDSSNRMDASVDGSDTSSSTDTDTDTDVDTDGDTDADGGSDGGEDAGPPLPVEWVPISGGTYPMGSEAGPHEEEQPAHEVSISAFEMTKTETTVFQYTTCFEEGACSPPNTSEGCNWDVPGRGNHPVNCVDVIQAETYCTWLGGRLPSESEWEYAARSLGQDIEYPWGDAPPSCEYAVMRALVGDDILDSCGLGERTWPVCSKPLGNTAQGLCDMAGNVWEWVPDKWHVNYYTAPTDGSVWDWPADEDSRVIRGGGLNAPSLGLRTRGRDYNPEAGHSYLNGFRCSRSAVDGTDAGIKALH